MTTVIRKSEYSAYVMTDDLEAVLATIERHAKTLRVSMPALALARHTNSFRTAEMTTDEQEQVRGLYDSLPTEIHQIELTKGPGGLWIADAMLKSGDARVSS